eukprot:3521032-Rhodomonas_salina.2
MELPRLAPHQLLLRRRHHPPCAHSTLSPLSRPCNCICSTHRDAETQNTETQRHRDTETQARRQEREVCEREVQWRLKARGQHGACERSGTQPAAEARPVSYTHLTLPTICSV